MNEKQLAKLLKQNAAKAEQAAKARNKKKFKDDTLAVTRPEAEDDDADIERSEFFKEMKRREF